MIDSEHVVDVIAAGVEAGSPWLAMELLRGESLDELLTRRGHLAPREVFEIYGQLCHAVSAAHDIQVVHRDLKPENIYLAKSRNATSQYDAADGLVNTDPEAGKQARAAALKTEGDELSRQRKHAETITAYQQAYALGGDSAVLYNQGRAYDKLGDAAAALRTLRRFEATAPPKLLDKVRQLDELLAELEGKVARLTVLVNVPGARVRLDDQVSGEAPLRGLAVNAGVGMLEVTREGHYPARLEVDLPKGESVTLQLELRSRESSGLVRITSGLEEVTAFVDGKRVGRVPAEVSLEPGEHQPRISSDS
ncbi:MAG: PEGA domain-containing protein [Polyangiaceae bacterium]|nr:PEGA domain-containing protein [Polyangiaceae bacterium]